MAKLQTGKFEEQKENNDDLIRTKFQAWRELDENLKRIKKMEMTLRIQLAQLIINGDQNQPLSGKDSSEFEYDEEITIRAKSNVSTKLDFEKYDEIIEEYSGEFDEDKLVIVEKKRQLSKKKLNNIPEDSPVHSAILEVPAAPEIEIKEK